MCGSLKNPFLCLDITSFGHHPLGQLPISVTIRVGGGSVKPEGSFAVAVGRLATNKLCDLVLWTSVSSPVAWFGSGGL